MTSAGRGTTLVSGAAGFVGSFLVPELEADGHHVVCLRKPGTEAGPHGAAWLDVDLRNGAEVDAALARVRPARVVHLAAIALPSEAAADPLEALRLNCVAVHHLAAAIARRTPRARLLHVGSGQVYGARAPGTPPLREETELSPDSIYAATKAAAEALLARTGLDVLFARPFNHSGPGRPAQYAESAWARQISRIERGLQEPVLRVGNLDGLRDFCDVRDVTRAYRILLERGESGRSYNVCSGRGRSLRAVAEYLVGRAKTSVCIEVDPSLYRPLAPERRALVGDPARLRALGWSPHHCFDETLDALLDDWRGRA